MTAGASFRVRGSGTYEVTQPFPERLLVTFPPYRLTRLTAGLAGAEPQLGLVSADGPLDWREPETPWTT
jgi:hypothetical protein